MSGRNKRLSLPWLLKIVHLFNAPDKVKFCLLTYLLKRRHTLAYVVLSLPHTAVVDFSDVTRTSHKIMTSSPSMTSRYFLMTSRWRQSSAWRSDTWPCPWCRRRRTRQRMRRTCVHTTLIHVHSTRENVSTNQLFRGEGKSKSAKFKVKNFVLRQ